MSCTGYSDKIFITTNDDKFQCQICLGVAKNPKQCKSCKKIFCNEGIQQWINKNKTESECPNCRAKQFQVQDLEGQEKLDYDDMKLTTKCSNYAFCNEQIRLKYEDKKICDPACILVQQLKGYGNDYQKMHTQVNKFFMEFFQQQYQQQQPQQQQLVQLPQYIPQIQIPNEVKYVPLQKVGGLIQLKWSTNKIGTNLQVTEQGKKCWLQEGGYQFRSAITDQAFINGIYYWEIILDNKSENELKIGVSTTDNFNLNQAFCDFEHGYSYYGNGQLRHNSNSSGKEYGEKFKNQGTIGCCLNMNKGQLSFSLNGKFLGIAYQTEALKKPPIYASVAFLHQAGCIVDGCKNVPSIFPQ